MNKFNELLEYIRNSVRTETGGLSNAYAIAIEASKEQQKLADEKQFLLDKIASQANMIDKLQATNESLELDIVELKNEIEADYNKTEDQLLALEDKLQAKAGHVDLLRESLAQINRWSDFTIGERIDMGSNGQRDHYRYVAMQALEQTKES